MFTKITLLLTLLSLIVSPLALEADSDNPTVAILRFGPLATFALSEKGTLDMLKAYGYVSEDERTILNDRQDLEGEHINIIWGDAGFDFVTANLMVRDAISRGADALITITTPVTQLATGATLDMEDPPVVIFNTVSNPYFAGIASASCIKPRHVSGSQALAPYERIVPLIRVQNPEIKVIGTMFNTSEANGVFGADAITAIGESIGLKVKHGPVTSPADLAVAAEGLVSRGVQAFILPTDSTVNAGLPAILTVATENGIPVFHASANYVYRGVTVGAGFYSYYQEGVIAARILIGHLKGEINIATTGINLQSGLTVAINLDTAGEQGVEISEELLAMGDFVVEDGQSSDGVTPEQPEVNAFLPEMTLEERKKMDAAFLAELYCSPERIANQATELSSQN